MSSHSPPNDLVLFHYVFSPYARRIVWYLQLRRIPYAQCLVPSYMPRAPLAELNVSYRRIPVLAHGREIYCDTRLILSTLDKLFPPSEKYPGLEPQTAEAKALTKLLIRYTGDAGIFARGASLIPTNMPVLKDEKWVKDREQFSGRKLTIEAREKGRPESLVHMRDLFVLMEHTLLADGRQWVLGDNPSVTDIEAVWVLHWMTTMRGALGTYITEKEFPKTFAYVKRFDTETKKARGEMEKPVTLKDDQTVEAILRMSLDAAVKEEVDSSDPTGLRKGEEIEMWPIDSGFSHKDEGELVGLSADEMIIRKQAKGKELRIHYPRWGFRIARAGDKAHL
ncbi:glutathione S-transferase [Rhizodiscina lignyota]|uniref:Glutathione S-transferase n=1 Tax=Rhizodiscina lignyota TaxID=1504668 RepID=A0A9P4IQW6_9PEZI|nr:glutathione S-transferase [Rhizodiscina lignyota]